MTRILHESPNATVYADWPYHRYELKEPALTEREQEIVDAVKAVLLKKTAIADVSFKHNPPEYEILFKNTFRQAVLFAIPPFFFTRLLTEEEEQEVREILRKYLVQFEVSDPDVVAGKIVEDVFGLGPLGRLLDDGELEEIMVNAPDDYVFVYHRKAGMCVTNIVLSEDEILAYIRKVASTVGKAVSKHTPFLDTHLPGGDRFNAVIPPIANKGPAITIRRFRRIPFTVADLLRNGTMSDDLAAFLWFAVEGMGFAPRNMIVAGGTGAGKTSTLDALTDFIPLEERVITVEDTRELFMPYRKNWVPLVARHRSGDVPAVDMDQILREVLRMRPDRIIVGEVRGPEAETLFIAMDVGHQGTMGTLHANSPHEVLLRLKSPPMNVPEDLLPLVNLILVQHRIKTKEGLIRRVTELAEVFRMDERVLLAPVFKMDPITKEIKRTDVPSRTIEEVARVVGLTKKEVAKEIERRKKVLLWAKKQIHTKEDFIKLVNAYYADPEGLLSELGL